MREPIVAIDGIAASGKSTTAQQVARHFHYRYVDTGAMYRAITWKALQQGIDPSDDSALARLVAGVQISLEQENGRVRVLLDRVDVTEQIRSREVTEHVSAVSEVKQVREVLVAKQREIGAGGGVVMEGRDIGTVVFPDAEVKIFMVADSRERAKRRTSEMEMKAQEAEMEEVEEAILKRDDWDSSRIYSPLQKAPDAHLVDTSRLTIEEQVKLVIGKVETYLGERSHQEGHI